MINMVLKKRIEKICKISKQDLLLSKHIIDLKTNKDYWSKWIPASKWNWDNDPTDRQVMFNEIIIETDEDIELNRKLTKEFHKTLKQKKISYYTFFTSSKSFHIHFFADGLEDIDGEQRKLIKIEIAKEITGKNYKYVDGANFIDKGLIRIENSIHPKTNKKVRLFDKFIGNNFVVTDELIKKTKVCKPKHIEIVNSQGNYCYVVEKALRSKFKSGQRNKILLPNCVAILSESELKQLALTQGINFVEINGWLKNKPTFNCKQLRRYALSIGEQDCCKRYVKDGIYKEMN